MDTSILNNTKKILGISLNDTSYDLDVIIHINSAFSILHQIGVGPSGGFAIVDATEQWADFVVDTPEFEPYLDLIKTCVYLRVRLSFDPPQLGFLINALEEQIKEHETRLSLAREAVQWADPAPPVTIQTREVNDGLRSERRGVGQA